MSVCRTCLLYLANEPKYLICNPLQSNVQNSEPNSQSKTLQLRTMLEKCMPEMDLEICESPVICERCYELLLYTYKFRTRCTETEGKIYQYIERNNLRLGESIDLSTLCEERPYEALDIKVEDWNTTVKEEVNEFADMPKLIPQMEIEIIDDNEDDKGPSANESQQMEKIKNRKTRNRNNSSSKSAGENSDDSMGSEQSIQLKHKRRPFTCDNCQYKASKWELLMRHVKTCNIVLFKCNKCSYVTKRQRNLKRHRLTHGGKRPWTCGVCQKGYTERNHLKHHMLTHSAKPLPFKCQEDGCSYSCPRKCDLAAHMVKHMKDFVFFCKHCKHLSFSSKNELAQHEKKCKMKSPKKKE